MALKFLRRTSMRTRTIGIWTVFVVPFGRTGVASPNLLEIIINLLKNLFGNDEWGLLRVKTGTRKFVASYYSNGFHHRILETDRPYALNSTKVCRCALCKERISSNEHILHCRWLDYKEHPIRCLSDFMNSVIIEI